MKKKEVNEEIKKEIKKMWKKWLIDIDKKESEVFRCGERIKGNQKINKGTIKYIDMAEKLDLFGYEIVIQKKGE